ncbi:MAG TPA: ABC transporter permease, partial [Thermoleophilia bacterium]|nr:ABC transporter permease [Thermoleophilia bacterium]
MHLRTIAFANLWRRKARAAFLVTGILIGVGTSVALLSLAESMTGQAENTMQTYGANILVSPDSKDVGLSYGGMTIGGVSVSDHVLRQADLDRIESIPARSALRVVAPELVGAVTAKGQRVLLMGAHPAAEFKLRSWWSVDTGRPPANGRELVAGAAAAKALDLQMGDYVTIRGRRFTVTGLLRETGAQDDHLLIANLAAVQQILKRPGKLTLIQVAAEYGATPVDEVVRQLEAALPQARVTAMQEVVKSRLHALDQFKSFSYAIVGVVVAIEALVVFITMMGSVNERTHEIGVFRAVGFRHVHITRLILLEAVVASLLAGVLGYVAGMAVTYAVLPAVTQGAQVAWMPVLAVAAVALAVATGGLASLYPAL